MRGKIGMKLKTFLIRSAYTNSYAEVALSGFGSNLTGITAIVA